MNYLLENKAINFLYKAITWFLVKLFTTTLGTSLFVLFFIGIAIVSELSKNNAAELLCWAENPKAELIQVYNRDVNIRRKSKLGYMDYHRIKVTVVECKINTRNKEFLLFREDFKNLQDKSEVNVNILTKYFSNEFKPDAKYLNSLKIYTSDELLKQSGNPDAEIYD